MIYYKEEKKKLVIPSGFVMIPIDCDEAIEQAREDGYREGFADGSSATCDTEEGTYSLTDDFDGEETVFPSEGKTGFNKIVIVDDGYGDAKYNEGYTDGIADCSGSTPCDCSSAVTEAYQSGYTEGYTQGQADCPECSGTSCNLEVGILELEEKTVGHWQFRPSSGYDGFINVLVQDAGFGRGKYYEGFAAGQATCSGGTCPTETGLINLDSGWSGYESYQPLGSGYYDEVIITDAGYGQAKFDQGYELGLATCSASSGSCLIEDEQTASLNYDWTGFTIVYPSQGYDGLGRVLVADLGYGQAKYDEGYADGHTSGYTEGYNDGYSDSAGRTKIIFKVRNAAEIQADLTFLSFSVNGVPVEDVGAIIQTEEIQYTNYTTLWVSGYTQPSIITGVEITIKAENIYLNTFNYDWSLFTEINGAEYEAASRSQEFFDIIDDNNKSRRIIYTYTGIPLYNEYSFEAGKDYGIEVGKPIGYKEGMDSVIKSVLDENDTDLVIAYYYTSAYTNCLITGEYDFPQQDIHIDGNECISAMSINGGIWQPVQKYLHLQSGWTQIRFRVLNGGYRAMFSHFFTPSEECYMDALKVVSIPSGHCPGEQMFRNNEGLRVLSTSCGVIRPSGATNLNVVITHYRGIQIEYSHFYFPSSGVLFIPEGTSADWENQLPNWTHIEMF